jgi:hypothetical protein
MYPTTSGNRSEMSRSDYLSLIAEKADQGRFEYKIINDEINVSVKGKMYFAEILQPDFDSFSSRSEPTSSR